MHLLLSQSRFGPTLITPLSSLDPPSEGTLKLNSDGSFLEDFGCLGVGGVVRNHDGDWIAGFAHYEVGVDLIIVDFDHTLHTYATSILHIRDVLHGNGNRTLVHILGEQNTCADFMAKEGSHARCFGH
uniref:Polynucleotidyl transferase, Ribonuclease H fold n=1 Tax=Medicago truncatula TaxID=3880 RepID=A2Q617_MEDTR|nr:Polynucleotidyl transferase, Ribonuclease H fold [Medicago truncatula]